MCRILVVGKNLAVCVKMNKVDPLGMAQGMCICSRVLEPFLKLTMLHPIYILIQV